MDISRRNFLKATGLGSLGLALSSLGLDIPKAKAEIMKEFKLTNATSFITTCHFCAVGCSQIGYVRNGKLIQLEGNADSPVNRGSLCSKGQGYSHIPNSAERVKTPLYRAPGSDHWEEISWEEAIDKAAKAVNPHPTKVGRFQVSFKETDCLSTIRIKLRYP